MKFIPLHTRNTAIIYKNSLCSAATILVLIFIMLSVMIPILLVSLLSPYSGITESRILYEQPSVSFQFKSIFLAQTVGDGGARLTSTSTVEPELVACSSFAAFNERMTEFDKRCAGTWYWSEDLDHDGNIDRAHFQLKLDDPKLAKEGRIKSFDLALFFDATLKHKCPLSPPALLTHHLSIPEMEKLSSGTIHLKAELQLKQYIEFTCPYPFRNIKTHFRQVALSGNESDSGATATFFDISSYKLESLLKELKANPAYFYLHIQETYFRRDLSHGLRILLDLDVLQITARYHLSIWERLGQFWLYFASFFGISFYVMNKLKDFLFGRHIIRSWEIIPWKKLY